MQVWIREKLLGFYYSSKKVSFCVLAIMIVEKHNIAKMKSYHVLGKSLPQLM